MAIIEERSTGAPSPQEPADIYAVWNVLAELVEQLSQNRNLSVSLQTQASNVKSQAVHSQTGFVLRRFNMDIPQDAYDSELERMNTTMLSENRELQHDNKQLNALIKEYEQTLETLMGVFRKRARAVQERELSLVREYETKLLAREEENATEELAASTALSASLSHISHALRQLLRIQNGEDPEPDAISTRFPLAASLSSEDSRNASASTSQSLVNGLDVSDDMEDREPWLAASHAQSDYALERDCELSRLEQENEELRRMMGLLPVVMPKYPRHRESRSGSGASGIDSQSPFERPRGPWPQGSPGDPYVQSPPPPPRSMGEGGGMTVGPFGTFKRMPGGMGVTG